MKLRIETLPIQDAIHTAQNTNELTTESKNFINELISGSQDVQRGAINCKHDKKNATKNDKVEAKII